MPQNGQTRFKNLAAFAETFNKAKYSRGVHCVKGVRIRRFSSPYFPAFGLNTDRYGVSLRIQSECGKIRTLFTQWYSGPCQTFPNAPFHKNSQQLKTLTILDKRLWTNLK